MSLCFTGPAGSVEQRWIVYALLRDNVQHYLEHGHPTSSFAALHAAGDALGGGCAVVDALQLRTEMEQARAALPAFAEQAQDHRTTSTRQPSTLYR